MGGDKGMNIWGLARSAPEREISVDGGLRAILFMMTLPCWFGGLIAVHLISVWALGNDGDGIPSEIAALPSILWRAGWSGYEAWAIIIASCAMLLPITFAIVTNKRWALMGRISVCALGAFVAIWAIYVAVLAMMLALGAQ